MAPPTRVVTRGSALALAQTKHLVQSIERLNPECAFEIVTLTTQGDRVVDRPLSSFRGIGVFVKELEKALMNRTADIAVHSLKDVPIERAEGLVLAAFPLRLNPADVLLTRTGMRFEELPLQAVIGTSSPRRLVQLKALRPDLRFSDLRGNLDTRIRKLEEGQYDAIIVAAAGMLRLGRNFDTQSILPFSVCLPAAGQGALVVECRASDERAGAIAAQVDDENTRLEVCAEREFLRVIGGGCRMPIAAYAAIDAHKLAVCGVIGDPQTGRLVREKVVVDKSDASGAGSLLAKKMAVLCKENQIRIEA
jgi:hydroxymethylbilane synthase